MISDIYKFIFLHIPKTGGTSIEKYIKPYCFRVGHHHLPAKRMEKRLGPQKFNQYFKFTFVRNPWDKYVSEYKWYTNKKFRWPRKREKKFYRKMTFKEFLKKFDPDDAPHAFSYSQMIGDFKNFDFIGRFESIEEDFREICHSTGMPKCRLKHEHQIKGPHYTEYYDDEAKQIVAEKYARDIEYFGYEFGE